MRARASPRVGGERPLEREASYEFRDAVLGKVRIKRRDVPAGRGLCVGTVDRGLVCLAPRPEVPRRRRFKEGEDRNVVPGCAQRCGERGNSFGDPTAQRFVRDIAAERKAAAGLVALELSHNRIVRPTVYCAGVNDHCPQVPFRSRNRGVPVGAFDSCHEERAIRLELIDEARDFHARIMPPG